MNSTDFIKRRLTQSQLDVEDFSHSFELNPKDFITKYYGEKITNNLFSNYWELTSDELRVGVYLNYDPEESFEYFTYSQTTHDGTLYFVNDTIRLCLNKVLTCSTYNKTKLSPANNRCVYYTIGNIVIVNEYGDKFAPIEKPWMQERTTAFLPIKYDCEETK